MNHTRHIWADGTAITADKLNNMESGIASPYATKDFTYGDTATVNNAVISGPRDIDTTDPRAKINRNLFMRQYNNNNFSDIPETLLDISFVVYRRVYWFSSALIMVELTELYPAAGRIWSTFYNSGIWSDWMCLSPSAESV